MKKLNDLYEETAGIFNQIHRNIPQILMFLIDASIMLALFARGTGKTHGVTATWVYLRAKILVRSQGFILSQSYAHLIDTIIPQMQQGWSELGLEENVHYWIRKKPPEELQIPRPYLPVDKPEYFIFWVNGSVTKLVSLDRKAMVNSKSFDYGAICEGRKLDGKEIQDSVIPTLRGGRNNLLPNGKRFGEMSQHQSLLIESDLPHDIKGRWILDYKKQVDQQTVDDIMAIQKFRFEKFEASIFTKNKKEKLQLEKEIEEIDEVLNEMRKDLVFVGKASTLDNIHALGIPNLKTLRRNLSPTDYDISILNIEQDEVPDCFYRSINKDKHAYSNAIDYNYIDSNPNVSKHDWRWDKDLDKKCPLIIAMDANSYHNCMGVMQIQGKKAMFVKYFYNKSEIGNPQTHINLALEVGEYYKGFPEKIIFVYNNTMIAGALAGLVTKADEVEHAFRFNGHKVQMEYLGQAFEHDDLLGYWDKFCIGELTHTFLFNEFNCEMLYTSWKRTQTKIVDGKSGRKIKKNKAPERDKRVPPEEAPHGGEMSDQLLQYLITKYNQKGSIKGLGAIAAG